MKTKILVILVSIFLLIPVPNSLAYEKRNPAMYIKDTLSALQSKWHGNIDIGTIITAIVTAIIVGIVAFILGYLHIPPIDIG